MDTVEVLKQRHAIGWEPGGDNNVVYLAADGGGMAGVISLGALYELEQLEMLDYVDGGAGSSGGSLNLAYAFTGQAFPAREVYTDYLPRHGFIRRAWPPVDMSVLRRAVTDHLSLDAQALVADPRELMIGASNLDKARADYFTNHDLQYEPDKIVEFLIAGAQMTMGLAGPYTRINGDLYADAGLFWPTTDAIARRSSATHILSIATSPRPTHAGLATVPLANKLQARLAARNNKQVMRAAIESAKQRHATISKFVVSDTVQIDNVRLTRIYPEGMQLPDRQTTDYNKLNAGFEAGRRAIRHAFDMAA